MCKKLLKSVILLKIKLVTLFLSHVVLLVSMVYSLRVYVLHVVLLVLLVLILSAASFLNNVHKDFFALCRRHASLFSGLVEQRCAVAVVKPPTGATQQIEERRSLTTATL